jgi:hypothetical protein
MRFVVVIVNGGWCGCEAVGVGVSISVLRSSCFTQGKLHTRNTMR